MRVLALDLGAERRGGQRQTLLLAKELARRGHDVAVAARAGAPLAADAARLAAEEGSGRVALAPIRPGSEASPGVLLDVARAARRFRPDVLLAEDARSHGAAVWARLTRHAPLVVHRRVVFPPKSHPLSRIKYAAAARYLAVSRAVSRSLFAAGVPRERIVEVPDGLPPEAFVAPGAVPCPEPPPFRLVHVGAFDGRKGQRLVVELVARLAAAGDDVTALFLGDGPARPGVETFAKERRVSGRCDFAGAVDPSEVPRRLAASHLLLLPSDSEAAPLALVEAMAAGCPVLAREVGGAGEMVAGGMAGRLLPDLDADRWEATVRGLMRDAAGRARLVVEGRRVAAERTIARTAELVEAELGAVASSWRGALPTAAA